MRSCVIERLRFPVLQPGLALAGLLLASAAPAPAQELVQDFRGGKMDRKLLALQGQGGQDCLSLEEEGLRLHFPEGKAPKQAVGVVWQYQVRGNFTVTAHYEILDEARPTSGYGVGVELYLSLDNASRDGIPFTRLNRPKEGAQISFMRMTNDEDGRRVPRDTKIIPAGEDSKRGKLRLARVGATFIASLAPGDSEEFTELTRVDIGETDIRMVRFGIVSGGNANARLDARLLQFSLKADKFGKGGDFNAPVPVAVAAGAAIVAGEPASPENAGSRRLFWIALALGGGGVVFLGVLLYARPWKKRAAPMTARKPPDEQVAEGDGRVVSFSCSVCGKSLKAKEGVAGKRVHCPGCGELVQVPA